MGTNCDQDLEEAIANLVEIGMHQPMYDCLSASCSYVYSCLSLTSTLCSYICSYMRFVILICLVKYGGNSEQTRRLLSILGNYPRN